MSNSIKRLTLVILFAGSCLLGGLIDRMFFNKHNYYANYSDVIYLEKVKEGIYNGNSESYDELKHYYLDHQGNDMLFWALFMANRYKDHEAYKDVYNLLEHISDDDPYKFSLEKMDELTQEIAIKYIILSAKNGDEEAIAILSSNDGKRAQLKYNHQITNR